MSLSRIAENNDCPVRFYAFEGISVTEQLCITFVDHVQRHKNERFIPILRRVNFEFLST